MRLKRHAHFSQENFTLCLSGWISISFMYHVTHENLNLLSRNCFILLLLLQCVMYSSRIRRWIRRQVCTMYGYYVYMVHIFCSFTRLSVGNFQCYFPLLSVVVLMKYNIYFHCFYGVRIAGWIFRIWLTPPKRR